VCIAFDLVLPSSHAIDSDDPPRYNVYGADFDNMRSLLSAVNWESDMFDLSDNDCWDYFSKTFDRIIRACVPHTRPKKCKKIYTTKEVVSLKNKKN